MYTIRFMGEDTIIYESEEKLHSIHWVIIGIAEM